ALARALVFVALILSSDVPGHGRDLSPILPDPKLTPGDVLPVTAADICVPGYSGKVRNVPESVKQKAYALYGITSHGPREYEVDHLISLELGGSNSIRNLWPQSYKTQPWNATVKDGLENRLHKLVCEGKVDLGTAQREIATDWVAAYKKYFGTDLPKGRSAKGVRVRGTGPAPRVTLRAPVAGMVWVNTQSGKYFRPGSRYYGKTKVGQYMTEAQALRQHYTAARN
ncbi:MAG TPA: hypothetical protein VGN26_22120, partial [Armatimonadota bacterium]